MPLERSPEEDTVRQRRRDEALKAGLAVDEAAIFAINGEDISLLRKLVRDGCPAELIALIVV